MKKLIILGSGSGYHKVNEEIKRNKDCDIEYEIWGCATNLFHKNMPKMDLIFEIHEYNEELEQIYEKMREFPKNKYIVHSKIPGVKSKIYPIKKIKESFGEYFCSSFAYMLVYAIIKEYTYIKFMGIDYGAIDTWREDLIERANLEHWIGYARGLGVYVNTNECPFLCRSMFMYGWERLSKHKKYIEDIRDQWLNCILDITDEKDHKKIKKYLQEFFKYMKLCERM